MGISFSDALGMKEAALKVRTQRAGVLASNLANVNTPGYKARDINFQEALRSQMSQTDMANGKSGASHDFGANLYYRTPHQPSVDGNTVEESVEHAEYMKNSLEFQTSFTMLNGSFKALRKAIKGE